MPSPIAIAFLSLTLPILGSLGQVEDARPAVLGVVSLDANGANAEPQAVTALSGSNVGSGLEVDDYRNIRVVVESLPQSLLRIGLSEDTVRTRTELRLRSANLLPLSQNDPRSNEAGREFLYVRLGGVGIAFSIDIEFMRPMLYFVRESEGTFVSFQKAVPSWEVGTTGTHGGDATYVLDDSLDVLLESFLNEYLRTNLPE